MDHHAAVDLHNRHGSASSVDKDATPPSHSKKSTPEQVTGYTSFPSPSAASHRTHSAASHSSSSSKEASLRIEAKYARYTDASPQYTEQQYQGKSEEEQISMRISDYAKEISRAMGRQLVRGLNTAQRRHAK